MVLIRVSMLVMSSFLWQNCGPYEQVSLYFLHLSSFHFRSLILNEGEATRRREHVNWFFRVGRGPNQAAAAAAAYYAW